MTPQWTQEEVPSLSSFLIMKDCKTKSHCHTVVPMVGHRTAAAHGAALDMVDSVDSDSADSDSAVFA